MPLNTKLFDAIYGLAHRSSALDYLGIFFADYSQYVLALIFLVLLFHPKRRRAYNREMACVATCSALIARLILKPLILLFCAEPRPFMSLSYVHPLVFTPAIENFQSFPSGHALFFFALAMTVFLFDRKWGIFYFAAAIVMGTARVYAGVHWPFDIVAGAAIGMITGLFTYIAYFKHRRTTDRFISFLFK